jgi:hypothetical protein
MMTDMAARSRRRKIEELLDESDSLARRLRDLAARLEEFTAHLDEAGGDPADAEDAHA